ncbi:MAG: DUF72 domain-containing protein [Candidatus Lokiarchaeota archaeon]|nr:DUF72 domain-containing protein [Candidatus Lokiarchaeota archaeon]
MTARFNIGTSGWSYDEWAGPVYPASIKAAKQFDFYSRLFGTVEINSSFYNIPGDAAVRSWAKRAPEGFTFAAKIYKGITHEAKLDPRKAGDVLAVYMRRFQPLDAVIHSYLLQLPPSFSKDVPQHLADLGKFLASWGRDWPPDKLVVEFRHRSWFNDDTHRLLKQHGATYCVVVEPGLPQDQVVTHPKKSYVRFHGFGKDPMFNYNFTPGELEEWSGRLKTLAGKVDGDVHVYFNNHFSGYAVQNAQTLMDFLDVPHPDLAKLQRQFSPRKGQTALDAFAPGEENG